MAHSRPSHGNIAFVTSNEYRDLTASDRIAAEALRGGGVRIVPAIWNDPSVHWEEFDAIIIRSVWDYHLRPAEFRIWIDSLERERLPVWNPTSILRWNMDKRYLLDLETRGVPIPRTLFLDGKVPLDLSGMRRRLGTDRVVVKPVVSASAWNTWQFSLEELSGKERKRLDELLGNTGIIVQEFMPEIATEGEWSLMFFGDRFSHSVRKYPAQGDFRVQHELGGRHGLEPNPPEDLIRQASEVLATVKGPLLYARVDGIVRDEKLIVMELELTEPSLFFDVDPVSAQRFGERVGELTSAKG